NYSALLTIHEESWSGDRLAFNLSALGQSAVGFIDVADDHVRLEVALPWLLAVVAEKFTPAIRKEGTLMLGKKYRAFRGPAQSASAHALNKDQVESSHSRASGNPRGRWCGAVGTQSHVLSSRRSGSGRGDVHAHGSARFHCVRCSIAIPRRRPR